MGWGIYLYPEIYYSKVDYKTKEMVFEEIESTKKIISMLERKLEGLAMMTEPAKMMSKEDIEEGVSPMEWVRHEVFQILSEDYSSLKDYYYELFKLELLYDHWDAAHNENGKAVHPPINSFKWPRTAYMSGDFIDSVLEDGTDPYGKEASYQKLSDERKKMVDEGKLEWEPEYKDWVATQEEVERVWKEHNMEGELDNLKEILDDELSVRSY
jgi:hypothetical protein